MEVFTELGRCPRCGGAVRADASWCGLCYLPRTVESPPARDEADDPAAQGAQCFPATPDAQPSPGGLGALPRPDPLQSSLSVLGGPAATAPASAAPAGAAAPASAAGPGAAPVSKLGVPAQWADPPAAAPATAPVTWPCLGCGADNPIEAASCQSCGRTFLASATRQPATRLPVIGDLSAMTKNTRYAVGIGLGLVGMMLIVAVVALIGLVL